jgi:hypothetical protein
VKSRLALSASFAVLALAAQATTAHADIFTFKDEKGVVHFTNLPPGKDARWKLVRKEDPRRSDGSPIVGVPRSGTVYMPSAADIARYSAIIDNAARTHGVDAALVHAVITAESGYNPRALSRTGAQGLMQLMPDTARRYGVANPWDPVDNIWGGVRYLKDLLAMFQGNVELAVAGYNAGENAVVRYGNRIPPYAETVHYVPKVIGLFRKFQTRQG